MCCAHCWCRCRRLCQLRESLVYSGSAAGLWGAGSSGGAASAAPGGPAAAETITVFGFTPSDRELVLHKFKSYGDIVEHKFVGQANWCVPTDATAR